LHFCTIRVMDRQTDGIATSMSRIAFMNESGRAIKSLTCFTNGKLLIIKDYKDVKVTSFEILTMIISTFN